MENLFIQKETFGCVHYCIANMTGESMVIKHKKEKAYFSDARKMVKKYFNVTPKPSLTHHAIASKMMGKITDDNVFYYQKNDGAAVYLLSVLLDESNKERLHTILVLQDLSDGLLYIFDPYFKECSTGTAKELLGHYHVKEVDTICDYKEWQLGFPKSTFGHLIPSWDSKTSNN